MNKWNEIYLEYFLIIVFIINQAIYMAGCFIVDLIIPGTHWGLAEYSMLYTLFSLFSIVQAIITKWGAYG